MVSDSRKQQHSFRFLVQTEHSGTEAESLEPLIIEKTGSEPLDQTQSGPVSLQLQDAVRPRVRRQVQLVLLLQAGRDKPPSQEVVPSREHGGRLLGRGQRDERVGLEAVGAAPLHVPTFKQPEP